MPYAESLRQLVGRGADTAVAVTGLERKPLTHGGLRNLVDEIPKRPTRKIQRIGLAEALGLTTSSSNAVVS